MCERFGVHSARAKHSLCVQGRHYCPAQVPRISSFWTEYLIYTALGVKNKISLVKNKTAVVN